MKRKMEVGYKILNNLKGLIILPFLFILQYSGSQEIKKDVTVVKPYQPTVSDASKINEMPVFNDTVTVLPKFQYSISPIQLNIPFQPRQISAAKMSAEPLKVLYNNYVKLGIGNRLATLAELSISSDRSKKNSYRLFLTHRSANGVVKLENDKKVDAPYADNQLTLYGKQVMKRATLSGEVGYTGNKSAFYGYNPDIDTILEKTSIRQRYQGGNVRIGFESLETDSSHLYYNFSGGYNYLADNFKNAENHILLSGKGGQQYKDYYVGGEVYYDYFMPGTNNDSNHNAVFTLKPYLSKSKGEWKFMLGLDFTIDNTEKGSDVYLYPNLNLQFSIVPSVLHAFVGYTGNLKKNNLGAISNENPFILPGLRLKNTNNKTKIFAGLKGNSGTSMNFTAQASYSEINDQYFFINDTNTILGNNFLVIYDNIELLKFSAEADFRASEKISFIARGNYNIFSMTHEEKPWHMPNIDASLTFKYNIRDKIIVAADIFTMGRRYARNYNNAEPILLDPFFDFNLGIEYRNTKAFSLFLQFKNITASRYSFLNQYPVYRFQVMGGFTYAL